MTPTDRLRQAARAAVAVAVAAAFTLGASTAHAATPPPGTAPVGVAVPSAVPTTPTTVPPPGQDPPPGDTPSDGDASVRPTTGGVEGTAGGDAPPAGGDAPACVPAEPAVPTRPAATGNPVDIDRDVSLAGQNAAATAPGFGAGEQVQLVLFSDPVLIGTFTADEAGTVHAVFPLAAETPSGTHTVQFTGWCKAVAIADILVGQTGASSAPAVQGVPGWVWWVGGGLATVLLAVGGWWLLRALRSAPAAVTS